MENRIKNIAERFRFTLRGFLTAILCVAIAIVLWITVMWIDAPEYTKEIEVDGIVVIGAESISALGITYDKGDVDDAFEISVKGSKTALYELFHTQGRILAAIDVSSVDGVGEYNLTVHYSLPDGVAVIDAPKSVTVTFTEK